MKKFILSLLCSFFLIVVVGCTTSSNSPTDNPDDQPSEDNPVVPPTDVNQEEPVIPDSTDNLTKYELGYGDYICTLKNMNVSALKNKYDQLSTVVKGQVNGIYQTSYEQGLLDLFNFQNEVKFNINISLDELKQLTEYHNLKNEESYRICSVDIAYGDLILHFENVI